MLSASLLHLLFVGSSVCALYCCIRYAPVCVIDGAVGKTCLLMTFAKNEFPACVRGRGAAIRGWRASKGKVVWVIAGRPTCVRARACREYVPTVFENRAFRACAPLPTNAGAVQT